MKGILLIFIFICFAALIRTAEAQSVITYDAGSSVDIGTNADVCADQIIINGTYSGGGTICSGPMPVTLLSFNSAVNVNNVKLVWVTSEEINNSGFDVERKTGQNNWESISFVKGYGTSAQPEIYTFEDKKLQPAAYMYRLKQIDYNGNFEYFDLNAAVVVGKPTEFSISQNYPNPSNPRSKIDYQIPFDGKVTLKVYDILGREVLTLANEIMLSGYYSVDFDGTNLASGVYFYRIIAEGNGKKFSKTLKSILVK